MNRAAAVMGAVVSVVAFAVTVVPPTGAAAAPVCTSWNLYSDFKTTPNQANPNPDSCANAGVWIFDRSTAAVHDPTQYVALDTYADNNFSATGLDGWYDSAASAHVPVVLKNTTATPITFSTVTVPASSMMVHPGSEASANDGFYVVVGWKSPVAGLVSVTGGVSSEDANGGNGIAWSIDSYKSATNTTLTAGSYGKGGNQAFAAGSGGSGAISNIVVAVGDILYFVVDPNVDYQYDSTNLDVTISMAPQQNVPEAPLGAIAFAAAGLALTAAWLRRTRRPGRATPAA